MLGWWKEWLLGGAWFVGDDGAGGEVGIREWKVVAGGEDVGRSDGVVDMKLDIRFS